MRLESGLSLELAMRLEVGVGLDLGEKLPLGSGDLNKGYQVRRGAAPFDMPPSLIPNWL